MNAQLVQLLAKFAIQARKAGVKVDLTQISKDREYAKSIFAQMDDVADEELLVLSIGVRNELGLLEPINVGVQEVKSTVASDTKAPEKYMFGARG